MAQMTPELALSILKGDGVTKNEIDQLCFFFLDKFEPPPTKGWYRVVLFKDVDAFDFIWPEIITDDEAEKKVEKSELFVKWLTDRVEYEHKGKK